MLPKINNGKDRTFFFVTYEALRLPSQQVLSQSVPSQALRNGDLSAYSTPVLDRTTGAPFAGNQIPASRISPLASSALKLLYPMPNAGAAGAISNNYIVNFPTPTSSNQGDIRVDQRLTANQSVFVRFTDKSKFAQTIPTGSALLGPFSKPEDDKSLAAAHNYVVGSYWVNEFRAGYSSSNLSTSYAVSAADIANTMGLTNYVPQAPPAGKAVPNFKISGFQSTGGGSSSISTTSTYQFLDNLTWTHDKHTIKMGGDYRYLKALYTNVFASQRLGSYSFNNSVTKAIIGNSHAAFLLGVPDSISFATVLNPDTKEYGSSYAFFIQDDYKVTSRLTINYGLRWEYHPIFQDHNNTPRTSCRTTTPP